jgi:hypothetical protein
MDSVVSFRRQGQKKEEGVEAHHPRRAPVPCQRLHAKAGAAATQLDGVVATVSGADEAGGKNVKA